MEQQYQRDGMQLVHWPEEKLRAYTAAQSSKCCANRCTQNLLSSFCRHLDLHNTQSHLQATLSRSFFNGTHTHIFSQNQSTHNIKDRMKQATCFGRLRFISFHDACFILSYVMRVTDCEIYIYIHTYTHTRWRTKCHTIDCTHNTFLLLQKHLTSGTELTLIGCKIVPNESL